MRNEISTLDERIDLIFAKAQPVLVRQALVVLDDPNDRTLPRPDSNACGRRITPASRRCSTFGAASRPARELGARIVPGVQWHGSLPSARFAAPRQIVAIRSTRP